MIYITSDQHWGHANIIHLSTWRKFENVREMNEYMIRAWNERVQPNDTVYHLGDIFWHVDVARRIRPRLNGHIKLIRGNHDWWLDELEFGERAQLDIDLLPAIHRLNFNKTKIWLCHYPLRAWEGSFKGAMHCYGHVHGTLKRLPRSMEMSVDVAGYQPWTVEEVWEKLNKDPIMPEELRETDGLGYSKHGV